MSGIVPLAGRYRSIRFSADGANLEVRLSGSGLDRLSAHLLRMLEGYQRTSTAPDAFFEVDAGPGRFDIRSGVSAPPMVSGVELPFAQPYQADDPEYVMYALDDWVDAASLLFGTPGLLRLHAASFVLDDECWVVAGASCAGKSTITLQAVLEGATFLTDERTTVLGSDVRGLARPLRLRDQPAQAAELVGGRIELTQDVSRSLACCNSMPVAPPDTWTRADHLVVITDSLSGHPSIGTISRALMESSMNIGVLGYRGLVDIVELVAASQVHIVTPRSLRRISDIPPPVLRPRPWRAPTKVTEESARPVGDDFTVCDGVVTLSINDEVLIWTPGSPAKVVELTGPGADQWVHIASGAAFPTGQIARDQFAGDLAKLGILHHNGDGSRVPGAQR